MVLPQLVAGEHLVWDIASLKEFRKKVMGKKNIEHYKKKKDIILGFFQVIS